AWWQHLHRAPADADCGITRLSRTIRWDMHRPLTLPFHTGSNILQLAPIDQTTVVGGANDQIGALVTWRNEQRIDVGLTVGNHNQARREWQRLLNLFQCAQPALTFALGLGSLAPLLTFGGGITRPDLLVNQAERDAVERGSQTRMHLQAGAVGVIKVTQA